ncbi:MAG: D-glycero-beta-D-manno-heptose-7-phosphate kinase [Alphaproteobacteria bacterium]|nr:D-glycero-beta-D-manno-heptose-7-phosphate kinase [Alphaproteobacteria bacterium]
MKQNNALETIIDTMCTAKILVIGDIMLDRFVYGNVDRISPEGPIPVLSVKRETIMMGGAGNTLSNLLGLETKASILSIIGQDQEGQSLRDLCKKAGVQKTEFIEVEDRPTSVKTRFLANHQQLLRTDIEKTESISKETEALLLKKAEQIIPEMDVVVLSDYGKGLLTPKLIQNLIKLAHKNNAVILVDPKGFNYKIYKGADIVTPNKKELSEATQGLPVQTDEEIEHAGNTLIRNSGIKAVIATRSADGISIIQKNQEPVHLRSEEKIEVFDVSGAGDTVIATIAATLAAGGTLEQAADLANLAGSIVVTKVGTAPIRLNELKESLEHRHIGKENKTTGKAFISSWDEAVEIVKRWKAKGLKVGFTNGCFDILHYGHVTYLQDARAKCDRLIVALNSDKSVQILKGPERPVHDETSRATVLASLASVNMVVSFGAETTQQSNTACEILDLLQPDIYFKGGDYSVDQIPEAPTVMRYGGIVDVMPVYDGHSTTSSIQKIKKSEAA